jgi:hypothetical protein
METASSGVDDLDTPNGSVLAPGPRLRPLTEPTIVTMHLRSQSRREIRFPWPKREETRAMIPIRKSAPILSAMAEFYGSVRSEVRRKFVCIRAVGSLRRLDYALDPSSGFDHLTLTTDAIIKAAEFWAFLRQSGTPTASPDALNRRHSGRPSGARRPARGYRHDRDDEPGALEPIPRNRRPDLGSDPVGILHVNETGRCVELPKSDASLGIKIHSGWETLRFQSATTPLALST